MSRSWWVAALVSISVSLTMQTNPVSARTGADLASPVGLADGPGIWVNIWSYPDGDLEAYCLKLHNSGIRNLFLQTSRSNTPAIQQPELLGRLIDTCHRYKIRVIAWSFGELANPEADAHKLVEAAKFRSATGQSFDAIAANLEKDLNAAKVEQYSKILREELGNNYPMIAVVFSPLNKAAQVALTPWKLLDKYYDVIAPMTYWNSKYAKLEPYSYTKNTIQKVRELVGRPDVEVHVIGDGMHTHSAAINECFKACHDTAATSASLYPFHKMTEEQFQCLTSYHQYFPVNSRYRLAAFHELYRTGAFPELQNDPSRPIRRGTYYRLLASKLSERPDIQEADAVRLLTDYSLLPQQTVEALRSVPLYLDQPLEHKEAYVLLASVMEGKAYARAHKIVLDGRKPVKLTPKTKRGDWFALPAIAGPVDNQQKQVLTYLDAAQIVVSAESGLK